MEDEVHVILKCPIYDSIRAELMLAITSMIAEGDMMNDTDVLGLALSNDSLVRVTAKTCKDIIQRIYHV